jgi:hypothetical protein
MRYDPWLWKNSKSMFELFGPTFGIVLEGVAIIMLAALLLLTIRNKSSFQWALFATFCMVLAHAAWWFLIYPVNHETVHWTKATIPNNWFLYRAQWEYTHAVRAILQIVSFSTLSISILVETKNDYPQDKPVR